MSSHQEFTEVEAAIIILHSAFKTDNKILRKQTKKKEKENGISREDYFLCANLIKGGEDNACNAGSVVGHIWQQARHHCLHLSIQKTCF